jgi:hypothetical protein
MLAKISTRGPWSLPLLFLPVELSSQMTMLELLFSVVKLYFDCFHSLCVPLVRFRTCRGSKIKPTDTIAIIAVISLCNRI